MEDRSRKISSITSAEIVPPILLRRRLSAPENIMRKHTLAQQRSSSQDSDRSHLTGSTQSCIWPLDAGSDPNLTRRRDLDISKSTLMKRFWERSKTLQFPRTYSEWQYSFGKMKIGSNHSTPEHLRKSIFEMSPKHKRMSQDKTKNSPKRKISVFNGNYSDVTTRSVKEKDKESSPMRSSRLQPQLEENNDDSYIIYSSNFSDATDTARSSRTDQGTPTTTTSVSTYTNTFSSFLPASSDTTESHSKTCKAYQIKSDNIESISQVDNLPNMPIKYEFIIRENNHQNQKLYEFIPTQHKTSATQTNETTNLNVISNVQLSESTLNLIFNKVMQDVLQNQGQNPENIQPQVINVQNLPSANFNIPRNEAPQKKSFLGKVNAGSPYKTKESPLVPRLSALPRSTSMEVNISSNGSFDKESDTGSLVDSLEDPSSPKDNKSNHDDKLVRGELSLLPDNSDNPKIPVPLKKSSVFYIPMKNDDLQVITEETQTKENVSSHLPSKLKERLLKRQIKREEKKKESRLRSFERIDIENGNEHPHFDSPADILLKPKTKKKKTSLPIIENRKEKTVEIERDRSTKTSYTQRSLSKYRESVQNGNQKSFWLPKARNYKSEKLCPLINKNEKEPSTSRRHYQKTETKQIEILEIMEIVEPERVMNFAPKVKSKIPVLVHQKLPKLPNKPSKSSYLDFQMEQNDPKLDQLIANILIDTLNREDFDENNSFRVTDNVEYASFAPIPEENADPNSVNNNPNLIEKAAELLTKQVLDNNNLDKTYVKSVENLDEKVQTDKIPKGWITFYMLQKNSSPDSTSDEGPKVMPTKLSKSTQMSATKTKRAKPRKEHVDYKSDEYFPSDSESENKYTTYHDRSTNRNGWSVTVSGVSRGETGPDVEMRLKFPKVHHRNASKEYYLETDRTCQNFPPLNNQNVHSTEPGLSFEDICTNRQATEINKSKQYLKNCESTISRTSAPPAKYEPRPTKTSQQRCLMNRPINRNFREFVTPNDRNHRNLREILEKYPEILTVNGNAVNKENKRTLSKLSEADLKRLLSQLNNQSIIE